MVRLTEDLNLTKMIEMLLSAIVHSLVIMTAARHRWKTNQSTQFDRRICVQYVIWFKVHKHHVDCKDMEYQGLAPQFWLQSFDISRSFNSLFLVQVCKLSWPSLITGCCGQHWWFGHWRYWIVLLLQFHGFLLGNLDQVKPVKSQNLDRTILKLNMASWKRFLLDRVIFDFI